MQFINKGPDIPISLIQAHKEGKVVFFCGAGISLDSGLPTFNDIVQKIKDKFAYDCPKNSSLFHTKKNNPLPPEICLNLFEYHLTDGRKSVREQLWDMLSNPKNKGSSNLHEALLKLSKDDTGRLHLVTTNFDLLFEIAAKNINLNHQKYLAPMLPIPNHTRWDGLVYLHGLMPNSKDDKTRLNQLILTSGDFGRAYLQEGWARRFLLELFRNFTVCFIGYSLNDAVVRYLTDAINADIEQGETSFNSLYAFCSSKESDRWIEKGVVPISLTSYQYLAPTIQKWSESYTNEKAVKEKIIRSCAGKKAPKNENKLAQVIWALSDNSGEMGKIFAELEPPADISWLDKLEEKKLSSDDLKLFNVDTELPLRNISLLNRPLSYDKTEYSSIFVDSVSWSSKDPLLNEIGNWLVKNYLGNTHLIAKAYNSTPRTWFKIKVHLALLGYQTISRKCEKELTPFMRTLWNLYLEGKSYQSDNFWLEDYSRNILKKGKLTRDKLVLLSNLLSPKIKISEKTNYYGKSRSIQINQRLQLDCRINLPLNNLTELKINLKKYLNDNPKDSKKLLNLFDSKLNECLTLNELIGNSDTIIFRVPSVFEHPQNDKRGHSGWERLIELVRDCWVILFQHNKREALRVAQNWAKSQFPSYKRLYLFTATFVNGNCVHWLNFLCKFKAKNLWDPQLKREISQLLLKQGKNLTDSQSRKLENILVNNIGYHSDEPQYKVCLYLARLKESGKKLSVDSENYLNKFSNCSTAEETEFTSYIRMNSDCDWSEELSELERASIPSWLPKENIENFRSTDLARLYIENTNLCIQYLENRIKDRDKFPINELKNLLIHLVSSDILVKKHIHTLINLILSLSDSDFNEIQKEIAYVILSHYRLGLSLPEEELFSLVDRIYASATINPVKNTLEDEDPVAIATECLVLSLLRHYSSINELPESYVQRLALLVDRREPNIRFAQNKLAYHAGDLYKIAPQWTIDFLLPLFDWSLSKDSALESWNHYLRRSEFNRQFSELLFEHLGDVIRKFNEFPNGIHSKIINFLFVIFNDWNLQDILKTQVKKNIQKLKLEEKILFCEYFASFCKESLFTVNKGQRSSLWLKRIQPFFKMMWPRTKGIQSLSISKSLAYICLLSGSSLFKETFQDLKPWIKPVTHYNGLIDYVTDESNHLLNKSNAKSIYELFELLTDESTFPYRKDELFNRLYELDPSCIELRKNNILTA